MAMFGLTKMVIIRCNQKRNNAVRRVQAGLSLSLSQRVARHRKEDSKLESLA